ncbi:MAG: SPOR domain-containing protein [Gemmatimonadota bacterium]|nr:MAG: SPOR domain-containing protein [Gemmatimonadota bacterium]
MTPRELPRAELPATAPDLLSEASVVVAVVLAGGERDSEGMAWELAAAVARTGRRVALVDLCLRDPVLDQRAVSGSGEGVVDAFLYGASLQHVAVEQDVPGLHVIPVGTRPTDPDEVWSHQRWRRLARGFGAEGALLILLVPVLALERLAVEPTRIVVLAPVGKASAARRLVLPVDWSSAPVDVVVDTPPPRVSAPPRPRPRAARPVVTRRIRPSRLLRWESAAAAALALGTVALAVTLPRNRNGAVSESTDSAAAAAIPAPATAEARPGADSLYYAVQVAAFQSMEAALEGAREYRTAGWTATVSPVRLGRQGTWYRLVVAAVSTPDAAERVLARLWSEGLVERPNGTILRTPHTIGLDRYPDLTAAREGLRERGAAAYIVEAPDGTARLFVGAFETPEQARLADSILAAAGLQGTVVPRTGIAR